MSKHAQIIALLQQGMTPQDVAARIGCRPEYVRACRAREWGNGRIYGNDYTRRIDRAVSLNPAARDVFRQEARRLYAEARTNGLSVSKARSYAGGHAQAAARKYIVNNSTPRS